MSPVRAHICCSLLPCRQSLLRALEILQRPLRAPAARALHRLVSLVCRAASRAWSAAFSESSGCLASARRPASSSIFSTAADGFGPDGSAAAVACWDGSATGRSRGAGIWQQASKKYQDSDESSGHDSLPPATKTARSSLAKLAKNLLGFGFQAAVELNGLLQFILPRPKLLFFVSTLSPDKSALTRSMPGRREKRSCGRIRWPGRFGQSANNRRPDKS